MAPDLPLFADLLATSGRFLWHPGSRAAILADLHLGSTAVMPVAAEPSRAWRKIVARAPRRVIMAGDVFDDPHPRADAVEACRALLAALPADCRVTITPGNHDPEGVGALLGVEEAEAVQLGEYVISHGHQLAAELAEARGTAWIVGHQHPAVTLRTRVQAVKMACFAVCGGARRLILLPAFSRAAGGPLGSNLLAAHHWLLPAARPAADKIRVYGLVEPGDGPAQVLDFGKLSGLGTDELQR